MSYLNNKTNIAHYKLDNLYQLLSEGKQLSNACAKCEINYYFIKKIIKQVEIDLQENEELSEEIIPYSWLDIYFKMKGAVSDYLERQQTKLEENNRYWASSAWLIERFDRQNYYLKFSDDETNPDKVNRIEVSFKGDKQEDSKRLEDLEQQVINALDIKK